MNILDTRNETLLDIDPKVINEIGHMIRRDMVHPSYESIEFNGDFALIKRNRIKHDIARGKGRGRKKV